MSALKRITPPSQTSRHARQCKQATWQPLLLCDGRDCLNFDHILILNRHRASSCICDLVRNLYRHLFIDNVQNDNAIPLQGGSFRDLQQNGLRISHSGARNPEDFSHSFTRAAVSACLARRIRWSWSIPVGYHGLLDVGAWPRRSPNGFSCTIRRVCMTRSSPLLVRRKHVMVFSITDGCQGSRGDTERVALHESRVCLAVDVQVDRGVQIAAQNRANAAKRVGTSAQGNVHKEANKPSLSRVPDEAPICPC
jgi:hypothetical protein